MEWTVESRTEKLHFFVFFYNTNEAADVSKKCVSMFLLDLM